MTAPPNWQHAVTLFNQGAYWESHEALESLWLKSDGQNKHFYAGIILLAAALHKARAMQNPRGGRRNYAKALRHLAVIPDHYHGVNVRQLESLVHAALQDDTLSPQIVLLH